MVNELGEVLANAWNRAKDGEPTIVVKGKGSPISVNALDVLVEYFNARVYDTTDVQLMVEYAKKLFEEDGLDSSGLDEYIRAVDQIDGIINRLSSVEYKLMQDVGYA